MTVGYLDPQAYSAPTDGLEDEIGINRGHFNEEWFWVFGYGTAVVLVIVANIMVLCSIGKNAFLHTNTHRALALLAIRHILRAIFGLAIVYITRWSHPTKDWKFSEINSTKAGMPLICDILCALDTFLIALPMFLLVGLTIHMFTRYPSPQFEPTYPQHRIVNNSYNGHKKFAPELNRSLMPREPTWLSIVLPILPILSAAVVATPIPLLHITQTLQAIPEKVICTDPSSHLTFDISVFIVAYCLPVLLMFFLIFGLFVRRCLRCSAGHCCNSWCKEEFVLVIHFFTFAVVYALMYLPLVEAVVQKLELNIFVWPPLALLREWIKPEIARATEILHGLLLPLLVFLCMPAYRQFCTEPDPDDLRNSTPKGHLKSGQSRDGAVLVGVKSLDLADDDAENESQV